MAEAGLGIIITPTDPSNTSFPYKINTVEERTWMPNFYFFAIPRSEIQINPSIKQNPGYN